MGHHIKTIDGKTVYQSDKFDVPPNHLVLNLEKLRTLPAACATVYAYGVHDQEFSLDLAYVLQRLHPEEFEALSRPPTPTEWMNRVIPRG